MNKFLVITPTLFIVMINNVGIIVAIRWENKNIDANLGIITLNSKLLEVGMNIAEYIDNS